MERLFAMRRSFTLIELLVVVAIISILFAVLLPSLKTARDYGKQIQCANNLRQINCVFLSYASENNSFLVPFWEDQVYAYDKKLYTNTLSRQGYLPVKKWKDELSGNVILGIWRCPSVEDPKVFWGGGYGVNSGEGYGSAANHIVGRGTSTKMEQIRRPSQIWLIGDVGNYPGDSKTMPWVVCPLHTSWTALNAERVGSTRHPGKCSNVGFADGHAAKVAYADLMAGKDDIFAHYSK